MQIPIYLATEKGKDETAQPAESKIEDDNIMFRILALVHLHNNKTKGQANSTLGAHDINNLIDLRLKHNRSASLEMMSFHLLFTHRCIVILLLSANSFAFQNPTRYDWMAQCYNMRLRKTDNLC